MLCTAQIVTKTAHFGTKWAVFGVKFDPLVTKTEFTGIKLTSPEALYCVLILRLRPECHRFHVVS